MKILGIETSCDETAAAIATDNNGVLKIASSVISSQVRMHAEYGGVIPELAAREHVLNIIPVISEAMFKAGISLKAATKEIDAIAVATGPGLVTSLITGVETAKTLAYAWNLPAISVNHIEGHIYANFIDRKKVEMPIMILTVSGGHTILALMHDHGRIETVGETRDDAAGEAFDKAAKLLGLGYPGGPAIAAEAKKYDPGNSIFKVKLPRPMLASKDLDFSFSGLKTALLYELKGDPDWKKRIPAYAYEFEQAIIDTLTAKTVKAAKRYDVKNIMLAGGVAANEILRKKLSEATKTSLSLDLIMPDLKYTTDNAAMMAAAGYYKFMRGEKTNWQDLKTDCNLSL